MSENVTDLKKLTAIRARVALNTNNANTQLGYMRGFQAGYGQAMKDAKRGRLHADYALMPGRAESRGKR